MLLVSLVMLVSIVAAGIAVLIAAFTFGFEWGGCSLAASAAIFAVQPFKWIIGGKMFVGRELAD